VIGHAAIPPINVINSRRLNWSIGIGRDAELYRRYAEELVALAPDVILAGSSPSVAALQRVTRSVPIVFAFVVDPLGAGFVTTLARPGGNITGFAAFEYSISGKWVELLKEIAPNVKRLAVLRDPAVAAGVGQFAVIQSMLPLSAVELSFYRHARCQRDGAGD
jgi:putative ABC transport system substrate-binding protein